MAGHVQVSFHRIDLCSPEVFPCVLLILSRAIKAKFIPARAIPKGADILTLGCPPGAMPLGRLNLHDPVGGNAFHFILAVENTDI